MHFSNLGQASVSVWELHGDRFLMDLVNQNGVKERALWLN